MVISLPLTRAATSAEAVVSELQEAVTSKAASAASIKIDLTEGLPAGRLYGESLGAALAVYLARRYGVQRPARREPRGGLRDYQLRRVLEYINAHLDQDLGLNDLAALAGLSTHYFVELFRQRVGKTPHRYVLERRIERAKELLMERKQSITDVALAVGFGETSSFSAAFRKATGVTPTDWLTLTAGGFRDTTRIAGGDPELWEAIFAANREAVLSAVDSFMNRMAEFRSLLERSDGPGLVRWLSEAKRVRDALGS